MPANKNGENNQLASWKEIAAYLGVDERTCQRWEKKYGLPVRRMEDTPRSRISADKEDLNRWREAVIKNNNYARELRQAGFAVKGESSSQNPIKRYIFMTVGLLVIAALFYIFVPRFFYDRQPSDFRIKGSKLIILDDKGKDFWDFDTGFDNLISEQEYRNRFQIRTRSQVGKLVFPYLVIKDTNLCGKKEVLFAPKTMGEFYETGLFCFDHQGKKLWPYKPGRELKFGERVYSNDYRVFGIEPFDINDDGLLEIFLITAHQPHSPSGLHVLDCRGKVLGEFFNWGGIHDIGYRDLDADGNMEIVIAGMNDEYGKGFLAAFDGLRIGGSSPQSEKYSCKDCAPGSEEYYILLPRTDVDKILRPDKVMIEEIHFLKNNRIELQAGISHIFFELDLKLRVQDVKPSDTFRNLHRELKAAGKITSELNDQYYEDLKKGVLYWNGKELTTTPSKNREAGTF